MSGGYRYPCMGDCTSYRDNAIESHGETELLHLDKWHWVTMSPYPFGELSSSIHSAPTLYLKDEFYVFGGATSDLSAATGLGSKKLFSLTRGGSRIVSRMLNSIFE